LVVPDDVRAQSSWTWKKPNWFAKDDVKEVEPNELTDEPAEPRMQNPFANWNLRPRPIEWRTPPFLQRMNENNMRAWNKTRRTVGSWASSTGAAIRRSSYNTWEALTGSGSSTSEDELDEEHSPAPNFGGVNDFLARPKLKF
jgi:hypothetical protein